MTKTRNPQQTVLSFGPVTTFEGRSPEQWVFRSSAYGERHVPLGQAVREVMSFGVEPEFPVRLLVADQTLLEVL